MYRSELIIPIEYKGGRTEVGYRLDLLVEDEIIVEIKSSECLRPIDEA